MTSFSGLSEVKPAEEPNKEEIIPYFLMIGAVLPEDSELEWIAKAALSQKLPLKWRIYRYIGTKGPRLFYNPKNKSISMIPPNHELFVKFLRGKQAKHAELEQETELNMESVVSSLFEARIRREFGSLWDRVNKFNVNIREIESKYQRISTKHSIEQESLEKHKKKLEKMKIMYELEEQQLKAKHEAIMKEMKENIKNAVRADAEEAKRILNEELIRLQAEYREKKKVIEANNDTDLDRNTIIDSLSFSSTDANEISAIIKHESTKEASKIDPDFAQVLDVKLNSLSNTSTMSMEEVIRLCSRYQSLIKEQNKTISKLSEYVQHRSQRIAGHIVSTVSHSPGRSKR